VHELVRQTLVEALCCAARRVHGRIAGQSSGSAEESPSALRITYHAGDSADLDITVGYLIRAARLSRHWRCHEEADEYRPGAVAG
jgi:hypothetical protein